jgi:hypothetical protein
MGMVLTDYDSRFKKISDNPRYIVINNYKCGFSSSNLLVHSKVTSIAKEDTVILFYRNIFQRAMSVFINWCITDDRHVSQDSWLLKNLQQQLDQSAYEWFLDLLRANKIVDAFTMYLDTLDQVYEMDNHTLPQVAIFEYYGFIRIDHFVDLEDSAAFFRLTSTEFPYEKSNKSNAKIKRALVRYLKSSERLQSILRHIYRKDIEYFKSHNIDVASLRSLR